MGGTIRWLAFMLVLLALAWPSTTGGGENLYGVLPGALAALGGRGMTTHLVVSGVVGRRLLSPAAVASLAEAVARAEGGRRLPRVDVRSSTDVRLARLSLPGLAVAVESVRVPPLAPVTLVTVDRLFVGAATERELAATVAPLPDLGLAHPELAEVLTAELPALGPTGRRRVAARLVGRLGARVETGLATSRLLTLAAWAPRDDPQILNGGRRMNLGVSVAYDSYRRRTEVSVGTPMLTDPWP
jgi:hypothetical protein